MKAITSRHPEEDAFEEYLFDRLPENQIGGVEEHLLFCEQCQATFAEIDDYVQLMKAATSAYAGNLRRMPSPRRHEHGLRWSAAAAAILLLTCLSALFSWRNPGETPKEVELLAYRGSTSSFETVAPAGRALDLRIDMRGVRLAKGYRVEIVDAGGRRVWLGDTPALLSKGLARGDYWVRLATDTGEPLREFGLHAE